MRVLIACEYSGIVRQEFTKRGHYALSCDLLPTEIPGNHYQGDVLDVLNQDWDLMIAHPPCTYLCVPGAHYLNKHPERWQKMLDAKEFFLILLNAPIDKICVENPVPHRKAELPKYSQIIHPWQFGHEISKRTCLWVKGLDTLTPTDIKEFRGERYKRADGSSSNSKWYASRTAKGRARTFIGIAKAMAEQWG